MYGSAGGFLSPENLVGRSGSKFPPEAATLSGLIFSANKINPQLSQEELKQNLYVTGPFWAHCKQEQNFYVPIPRSKVISQDGVDEWSLKENQDKLIWHRNNSDLEAEFTWQTINLWEKPLKIIQTNKLAAQKHPWQFIPILHPRMKPDERHVKDQDGLFLENAVQMPEGTCLVYLSTHQLPSGWYKFGGENHIVEIDSQDIKSPRLLELLQQPIQQAFALITPAVWGSNRLSYRYPQHPNFPKPVQMLTEKAVSYRYSAGGKLGRGRYAVPAGTVCVLDQPLNMPWWDWPEEWFPNEGYSLKRVGCGLCLPIKINNLPSTTRVA